MLPSQRMLPLDKTTNLGLIDPLKMKSADILNVATNQLQEVTSGLSDFVKSMKQQLTAPLSGLGSLNSLLDQGIRATRDVFTSMANITNFSPQQIESAIASMLPGDLGLQNVFRNVTAQCRNKGLGTETGFKKFKDNASCGSPKGGRCSSSQMSGILDKLTGGAASAISRSLNSMLKQIMALGNMGYDAGLCKIFGELVKGMPSGIIQRGAAGLLAIVGGSGKTNAVMDIAANMGNSKPSLEIPGLTGIVMSNFKTPGNYTNNQLPDLVDGYFTAVDAIKPGWNKSTDNLLSLANVGNARSGDLTSVLGSVVSNKSLDLTDISKPVKGALDSFAGAYKTTKKVGGLLGMFA